MGKLKLNIKDVAPWAPSTEINAMADLATAANKALHEGTLSGNDFLPASKPWMMPALKLSPAPMVLTACKGTAGYQAAPFGVLT